MKLNLVDPGVFSMQPSWWKNFVFDVVKRFDEDSVEDEFNTVVNELNLVGATVIFRDDEIDIPVAIEFEDDKLATWFLLRWT